MDKRKKINLPLGTIKVEEDIIYLDLQGLETKPEKMFFNEKLYYGTPSGNNISVSDTKAVGIFMFHLYKHNQIGHNDEKRVEECLSLLYMQLLKHIK